MLEYIKIPKVISKENYEFKKDELFEYKIVEKTKNYFYLLNENTLQPKYFLVNDIIKTVNKKYGNTIFYIVVVEEDLCEIIVGYSNDEKIQYFFKNKFKINQLNKVKLNILNKIDILKIVTNSQNEKPIYFSYSNKSDEIATLLFGKDNYQKENFLTLLKKIPLRKDIMEKTKPLIIIFFSFITLWYGSTYVINKLTTSIIKQNKIKYRELNKELIKQKQLNYKYLKKFKSMQEDSKNILKYKNNIYTGDQK